MVIELHFPGECVLPPRLFPLVGILLSFGFTQGVGNSGAYVDTRLSFLLLSFLLLFIPLHSSSASSSVIIVISILFPPSSFLPYFLPVRLHPQPSPLLLFFFPPFFPVILLESSSSSPLSSSLSLIALIQPH